MDPTLRILTHFGENFKPGEGQVHVLVVVPEDRAPGDSIRRRFNALLDYSNASTEGGVPPTFQTYRIDTVKKFFQVLFPDNGEYSPVIVVRSPPLSGKTAMCHLLYNHIVHSKPDALVLRSHSSVTEWYWLMELKSHTAMHCCGWVISNARWMEDCLECVLFSSYGSFGIYGKHAIRILIPPENMFGLNATQSKPGLQLSREELEEMIQNSLWTSVSDLIWILCSGHIGITRAMLRLLHDKFGSKSPGLIEPQDIEMELRSEGLLEYIRTSYRGISTAAPFSRVLRNHDLSEELTPKMSDILNDVANGKVILACDEQQTQTAVEYLSKYWILYERGSSNSLLTCTSRPGYIQTERTQSNTWYQICHKKASLLRVYNE
ncbi:unnamed protein product [Phytophthora lilii]|uniref:Unnamed protein product n=1 Tax=Phytophthora lilii TaxID=2077276 RepID=A0A9W6TDD1_9STRA|nr:unnamed protein product [Phytophthora lilii]